MAEDTRKRPTFKAVACAQPGEGCALVGPGPYCRAWQKVPLMQGLAYRVKSPLPLRAGIKVSLC